MDVWGNKFGGVVVDGVGMLIFPASTTRLYYFIQYILSPALTIKPCSTLAAQVVIGAFACLVHIPVSYSFVIGPITIMWKISLL